MQHAFVRLYGVVLLVGVAYIVVTSHGRLGLYTWPVVLLGLPAGVGMILWRPWGRILGFLFSSMWLMLAVVFLAFGRGFTVDNVVLLVAGLGGLWTLYRWE